jgi:acyl-CoA synthetase (AMP-forming)/AMP-acid ligase II
VLTHGCALASLRNLLAELHELGPADTVAHVAPLTHASEALLAPAFWRGARSILCTDFEPAALRDLIERERVTMLFLVPTMIASLIVGRESSARPSRAFAPSCTAQRRCRMTSWCMR